jgi:hypothetical protein
MAENKDPQTPEPQSTAIVQSGLIGHLTQPGPEHKLLDVFIGKWMNEGQNGPQFLHNHCSFFTLTPRIDTIPTQIMALSCPKVQLTETFLPTILLCV